MRRKRNRLKLIQFFQETEKGPAGKQSCLPTGPLSDSDLRFLQLTDALPVHDVENLRIGFDGRYNIQELLDKLEKAILDFEAQMGLRMAARLTEVVHRLANHLITIFSGIAGTVALTPIPVSDIYVLLILQSVMVALVAALSGRDISLESAKEFILGLGGVAALGYGFKLLAQQASKFLNAVWPGIGSAVSAGIATGGTAKIGQAAVAYFISETDLDKVKAQFEERIKSKAGKSNNSTSESSPE